MHLLVGDKLRGGAREGGSGGEGRRGEEREEKGRGREEGRGV